MAQHATLVHAGTGWSVENFPAPDSTLTLGVALGGADLAVSGPPLTAPRAAYPTSRLIGCSSAGEIAIARLLDDSVVVGAARFGRSTLDLASLRIPTAPASCTTGR